MHTPLNIDRTTEAPRGRIAQFAINTAEPDLDSAMMDAIINVTIIATWEPLF
jgi:hypothetical protein